MRQAATQMQLDARTDDDGAGAEDHDLLQVSALLQGTGQVLRRRGRGTSAGLDQPAALPASARLPWELDGGRAVGGAGGGLGADRGKLLALHPARQHGRIAHGVSWGPVRDPVQVVMKRGKDRQKGNERKVSGGSTPCRSSLPFSWAHRVLGFGAGGCEGHR